MTPDQELVLLFGGLHLVALLLGCALFWMFLRSETSNRGSRRTMPTTADRTAATTASRTVRGHRKPGGLPLPDADQSSERFRGPGRLADRYPWPLRRAPEHEPQRTPERVC